MPSDIVVTGVGVLAACGIGVEAFWDAMQHGRSGIRSLADRDDGGPKPPADWRTSAAPGHWIGGPILGFDAAQFVRPRKALKVMGRELQTSFAASQMAMEQSRLAAAIDSKTIDPHRIATIFGSQMLYGPAEELLDAVRHSVDENHVCDIKKFGTQAMADIMPLWMLKYLPNMAACHVGISIGAMGPNNTIVSGDVSATSAVIESIGALERGVADAVICGATGSRIDETYLVYRGDSPVPVVPDEITAASRPHAVSPSGVVLGEAAATLVMESGHAAAARGAHSLARIVGYASRFVAPPANQRGSAAAILLAVRGALEVAKMKPSDVGLIVSHGTGDWQRDEAERRAICELRCDAPIVAPISLCGHCGAATGALHLVTAVMSLMHQIVPATPHADGIHTHLANRFPSEPAVLEKPLALVLTHTSHGNANAVLLSRD